MKRFLQGYKAAIFDLDGTLADSMTVWDTICRDWLTAAGCTPPDDLENTIALMTLTEAAQYVVRAFTPHRTTGELQREWQDIVAARYRLEVQLKPGAAELVRALAEKGMPLAVATSCFPAACEGLLERYGLLNCFTAIVYADAVGKDKTHPDIYLTCAEKLGIAPADCVVFEDLYAAAQGVRAACMGLVAVQDASCREWEQLRQAADWAVTGSFVLE